MHIRRHTWCPFGVLQVLAGCDQQFRLLADDGSGMRGTIVISARPPDELSIALKGEEFAGYWRSYVVPCARRHARQQGVVDGMRV